MPEMGEAGVTRVEGMSSPVVVVVGAGPGVSGSVARRFALDGYDVGLLGTDEEQLEALSEEIRDGGREVVWRRVDVTDVDAATAAVAELGEHFVRIDVLHFNPSAFRHKDPLQLTVPELLEDVALGVGALLTAVQAARPFMSPGGRVTATGSVAADKPWHEAASLGVQKAGLRNLVRSLDTTLAPAGIRAVSVTVVGSLAKEGPFTPDRVAEAIHAAACQDEAGWHTEVRYEGD
jgi:NAD(P)-dependent dehydrogenase (short-subunit alcohol dehydrogenase family)